MSVLFMLMVLLSASPAGASAKADDALRDSVLRLASGDVAGAEASARAAVAAAPDDPKALQQLARAADAALDFPTAEDAATRALAHESPTPAVLCLRSEARSARGDYDGAFADAQNAARLDPASAVAALRLAVAKEGMRRPPEETLTDYRRAAQLDPALVSVRDEAEARLAPPKTYRRGWGSVVALLAFAGLGGWLWGYSRRMDHGPKAGGSSRLVLPGTGRLAPRAAARALAAVAARAADPEASRELAESLYERLTGRSPYPSEEATIARGLGRFASPSKVVAGLPIGIDAFFARALDADPSRRFRTGAELSGAFRSVVEPAVD